jgi:protein-S-isoprenylcysteine O-methyltransferase Ste14
MFHRLYLTRASCPERSRLTGSALRLVFLGLAFAVWARRHIGSNWSGTVTVKENHALVRTGPYAWVRHPIYTGLLAAILGSAIARGELRGVWAVALCTIAFVSKLRTEERWMRKYLASNTSATVRRCPRSSRYSLGSARIHAFLSMPVSTKFAAWRVSSSGKT